MDRVKLTGTGAEFLADYAAPSVLTGRFVATIIEADAEAVRAAFTSPGVILVENIEGLYAPAVYDGYDRLHELRENGDRVVVILSKGEQADGQGTV